MDNYIFPFLWMRGESEEILRREIEKIDECGIRAVCVEARPHDDFCGPGWWHDMDIVLDEAKKRGMKVWILDDKHFPTGYANGLIEKKYPERKKRYIACTVADVFGSERPVSLNIQRMLKPSIGFWEIGNPVDYEERARNRLLCVTALRFGEGDHFLEEAIDLTDCVRDGVASFTLPKGQWRVHVLYHTRTDGGNDTYINMIDGVSAHTQIEGVYEAHFEHYPEEFGKTIAGFFSDEPQFGNISDQCFDTKLGKPKMPLPWSDELEDMLTSIYHEELHKVLPFLFAKSAEQKAGPQIRYDYMDAVSKLYAKHFSRPIGAWCHAHGVEYIGHVVEDNGVHSRLGLGAVHWFRAMEGQDMAGIDIIGGQYFFGAPVQERAAMTPCDGEFFHYALGKLGASGGHLDPKKKGRAMCELFGAYGWSFGVRDMKHLLDHLLSKGINHLVPHAFSMAEYPDHDCPPHFYAGGHNPQFAYFAHLMKYANRMCGQLNGGIHVPSVAVLYDAELDWTGDAMPMQKVCRILTENQIEFDIVCLDMLRNLKDWQGSMEDGKLILNGMPFEALLVPGAEYVPEGLVDFARENPDFPVWFVGNAPDGVLRDEGGNAPDLTFVKTMPVVAPEDLAGGLEQMGSRRIFPEPSFPQLNVYHYRKEGEVFFLMNESPDLTFAGMLRLPAGKHLALYDAFHDRYEALEPCKDGIHDCNEALESHADGCDVQKNRQGANRADRGVKVHLVLEPGESLLIRETKESALPKHIFDRQKQEASNGRIDLSEGWDVTCAKADGEVVLGYHEDGLLRPVSERLPKFSGIIRYEKEFSLEDVPRHACFLAQSVYEVMHLKINGSCAGRKLTPPYQIDISGMLRKGPNRICVEVATTPARDQLNYPMPPFDFTHEVLEATGMFGKIEVFSYDV